MMFLRLQQRLWVINYPLLLVIPERIIDLKALSNQMRGAKTMKKVLSIIATISLVLGLSLFPATNPCYAHEHFWACKPVCAREK